MKMRRKYREEAVRDMVVAHFLEEAMPAMKCVSGLLVAIEKTHSSFNDRTKNKEWQFHALNMDLTLVFIYLCASPTDRIGPANRMKVK